MKPLLKATTGALMGLALAVAPQIARAETIPMTVAAGHPPVFLWVKLLQEQFIPEVDRRLKEAGGEHRIEWTEAYGGTVAKIGGVLEAIEADVADMGFVGTLFEAAKMPLQNVTYMTPFGSDDIFVVTKVVQDLHDDIPAMRQAWVRNNQVFLTGVALDSYHLVTKFPVHSIDDLNGRKIAAPGPAANWLKGTGAVPVAGNLQTYYNDIKTGVYDGTLTFLTAAAAARLNEVAPYIVKVDFGAMFAGGLSVNKDVWDTMPEEVRQVFLDVAADYRIAFAQAQTDRLTGSVAKMVEGGAEIIELDPAERLRWAKAIPNVSKQWAADLEARGLPARKVVAGYLTGLRETGTDLPRNWDKE